MKFFCSNCRLPELDSDNKCKACGHNTSKISKNASKPKEKKESSQKSDIDNLACLLIHRIDDLLDKKPSPNVMSRLQKLKDICWSVESVNILSDIQKELDSNLP